jgi:hypothetical protein
VIVFDSYAISQLKKSLVSSVTGDLEISISGCGQVAENINFNMYVIVNSLTEQSRKSNKYGINISLNIPWC